jgi:tRNA(adenine34) deaminase
MDESSFMDAALREAKKAQSEGEVPIGAVVVFDGNIISRGRNQIERTSCATRHAEMIALERASKKLKNWRLKGCTLYVTVEPCPMCASAATLARVDRIVYGAADELFGACGTVFSIPQGGRLKHTPRVEGGIAAEECRHLMQAFFKSLR